MALPGNSVVQTAVADGVLTLTVSREFDSGNAHQDWAQQIQTLHPGPFTRVAIDCSGCGLLSSTFFAGIMQLKQHYGQTEIALLKPDPRVVRNLSMLKLAQFFTIVAR